MTDVILETRNLKKSFGKLEVLGAFAFSGTKLTTVTLPASFSSLYYTYVWDVLDTKGRVKETRQREVQSYGDGAFANIPTLTAILVADGSEAFESRDGVLYGKAVNGSVLLQYPAGRDGKSYAAAAGTVRMAGTDKDRIFAMADRLLSDEADYRAMSQAVNPYGDGRACTRIADAILYRFGLRSQPPEEFSGA